MSTKLNMAYVNLFFGKKRVRKFLAFALHLYHEKLPSYFKKLNSASNFLRFL